MFYFRILVIWNDFHFKLKKNKWKIIRKYVIKSQKNISTLECIACLKAAFIILVMFLLHCH